MRSGKITAPPAETEEMPTPQRTPLTTAATAATPLQSPSTPAASMLQQKAVRVEDQMKLVWAALEALQQPTLTSLQASTHPQLPLPLLPDPAEASTLRAATPPPPQSQTELQFLRVPLERLRQLRPPQHT